jgi:hypothetical protein
MKVLVSPQEENFLRSNITDGRYISILTEITELLDSKECNEFLYIKLSEWLNNYNIELAMKDMNFSAFGEGTSEITSTDQFSIVLGNVLSRSKLEEMSGGKVIQLESVANHPAHIEEESYTTEIDPLSIPAHLTKVQKIIDQEIAKALKNEIKKRKELEKELVELKGKLSSITEFLRGGN